MVKVVKRSVLAGAMLLGMCGVVTAAADQGPKASRLPNMPKRAHLPGQGIAALPGVGLSADDVKGLAKAAMIQQAIKTVLKEGNAVRKGEQDATAVLKINNLPAGYVAKECDKGSVYGVRIGDYELGVRINKDGGWMNLGKLGVHVDGLNSDNILGTLAVFLFGRANGKL